MRSRPSALRVGAVVLAITLGMGYVWYRAAQARERREAAAAVAARAAATQPATSPASVIVPSSESGMTVMPGSKFSHMTYKNPYPDSNAIGAGFKLNNSISAEFAVASDVKAGLIDLVPNSPTTQPTTQPK